MHVVAQQNTQKEEQNNFLVKKRSANYLKQINTFVIELPDTLRGNITDEKNENKYLKDAIENETKMLRLRFGLV